MILKLVLNNYIRCMQKMRRSRNKKPKTRSQMMQAVHSKDTGPEIIVRKALFGHGFRYRLHQRGLPGTPDIFVLKYNVVIFINGCFWHQHGCKFTTRPKSNSDFWNNKFANNSVRDIKTHWKLSVEGYRVATVWECSLMNKETQCRTMELLMSFIKSDEESTEI